MNVALTVFLFCYLFSPYVRRTAARERPDAVPYAAERPDVARLSPLPQGSLKFKIC